MNLILSLLISMSFAGPKTVKELKEVTAQISDPSMQSGGSGSVIQVGMNGSIILTNQHVCEATEPGWIVTVNGSQSRINKIKFFDQHDLCLIHVPKNFGKTVHLSKRIPKATEKSVVSGHPLMLPQIVTEGHFSDEIEIEVMVDVRACTPEEEKQYGFDCMFGMPVTKRYKSQLTSNLIQPGNSGSAVYNEKGEVAGVIFAGAGEIGFAFIVPAIYVTYFVVNNEAYPWEKLKTRKQRQKDETQEKVKTFCIEKNTKICKINDMLMR